MNIKTYKGKKSFGEYLTSNSMENVANLRTLVDIKNTFY